MKNYTLNDYDMRLFYQFKDKVMEYDSLFCEKYGDIAPHIHSDDITISFALLKAMYWYDDFINDLKIDK